MQRTLIVLIAAMLSVITGCVESATQAPDIEGIRQRMLDIERGRYVVVIMGCNDCHTPDYMVKRSNIREEDWLVGSNLGFRGPLGTSYPTNLRRLINDISEEDWLILAKQMRDESPMADVMLPETVDQDLRAIYSFIKYLGPKGLPAPDRLPKGVMPTSQYIDVPNPH